MESIIQPSLSNKELLLTRSEHVGSRLRRSVRILVAQQNSGTLESASTGPQTCTKVGDFGTYLGRFIVSDDVSHRHGDDPELTYFEHEALTAERRLQSFRAAGVGLVIGAGIGTLLLVWSGVRDAGVLLRIGVTGGGAFGAFLGFFTVRFRRSPRLLRQWLPPIAAAVLTGATLHRYSIADPWESVGIALGGLFVWAMCHYDLRTPIVHTVFVHPDESPKLRVVQMVGAGILVLGATTCTVAAASDTAFGVGFLAFTAGVVIVGMSQLYLWFRRLGGRLLRQRRKEGRAE